VARERKTGRCQIQHIICDGASTDNTADIAGNFRQSEFLTQSDGSMYDALVKGLQRSRGEITGYPNAGDTLFPWALDVLLDIFRLDRVLWATGYCSFINTSGQVIACGKPTRCRREFVLNGFYVHPSYPFGIQQGSTFWRSSLHGVVDFKRLPALRLAGDYFLWTEFAKVTELNSICSPLGASLQHDNQLSLDIIQYEREAKSFVRVPTWKERFTAWWETKCNPLLKSSLWRFTLGKDKASIF